MKERTIPILPCRSIHDVLDFYRALGFIVTYQQEQPNTDRGAPGHVLWGPSVRGGRPRGKPHPDRATDRRAATAEGGGRRTVERALIAAITLADSKGDDQAAARVLGSAFADDPPVAGPIAVRALILRADLAYRTGDTDVARTHLAEAQSLGEGLEDDLMVDELRRAAELGEELRRG